MPGALVRALWDNSFNAVLAHPAAGSGSTLLAAERTARVFRGIELDTRYVEVALERWQQAMGEGAVIPPVPAA
ncbi:MAG: site-specific DNA-methyltransferase [Candidatus Lambdaproteobacteria bacterium]|nr:site-specific DNA-methyltransferase [Candidatus Lambdaproteobacteria bacterium]